MKILITGGLGYIGYFTIKELIKNQKNDITIIDDFSNNQNIKYFKNLNIKIIKSDYSSKITLKKIFKKKIDFVIHLASYKKVQESLIKPNKYYKNNVIKTIKFLDICKKNKVKKIIFASSASIYGKQKNIKVKENFRSNPLSPYAKNKIDIENYLKKLAKKKKIQFIILRYFNIAGGDYYQNTIQLIKINNFIHKAIKLAKKGLTIPIYGKNYNTKDGTPLRDYIFIKDVAKINAKILDNFNKLKNNVFNIGSGKSKTLIDVLKSMKHKKIKIKYFPRKLGDIEAIIANNDKINKKLKIKKYSSLKKIVNSL